MATYFIGIHLLDSRDVETNFYKRFCLTGNAYCYGCVVSVFSDICTSSDRFYLFLAFADSFLPIVVFFVDHHTGTC